MPRDSDLYDFFVSYARNDNQDGWITQFLEELLAEHRRFSGGRELTCYFDQTDIHSLSDWRSELFNKAICRSRLFVAFLSPNYFASECCRQEWRAWIDQEIARHILTSGAAPIYCIEVPGFVGNPPLDEHEVARKVAELCALSARHDRLIDDVSSVVREIRPRQFTEVRPFYHDGKDALRETDLRQVLNRLARDLDERAEDVKRAEQSKNTVPPYNANFSGRLQELLELRDRLKDDRTGVISGIHGLGGIGKTELAFTYAHAFAGAYPGGRFLLSCEGHSSLRDVMLQLGDLFRDRIGDEQRKHPDTYFSAVIACLQERLDELGHILLVLDNVSDHNLVAPEQTDAVTALGPQLHLLATTRLPPRRGANWVTLGELKPDEALAVLEKHRPFADDLEETAARRVVERLGGFALAIELVAAWLAAHPSATYAGLADGLRLDDLDTLAEDENAELRRHNHERRLRSVLQPTLDLLNAQERTALNYAALLPPDQVALPWLKSLVTEDYPELAEAGRFGDPWQELCERLFRLGLFSRQSINGIAEEEDSRRVVRVHRLVQDLIQSAWSLQELTSRRERIVALIRTQIERLKETTHWRQLHWETAVLESLAHLWSEPNQGVERDTQTPHVGMHWHDLAEEISEASNPADPNVAKSLNDLALLLSEICRPAEAESLFRRALEVVEARFGPEDPNVAACLNNQARTLMNTNRAAEADPIFRRALTITESLWGADHPHVAAVLNGLAHVLQVTNRPAEAESVTRRALAIQEASLAPDDRALAQGLNELALSLFDTNRVNEAEPLFRRALAINEVTFGPDHPEVAVVLDNLANLLLNLNRLREAEPLLRRALLVNETAFGPDHPRTGTVLKSLSNLLRESNRLEEAETIARRALAIQEASLQPDDPAVSIALLNLAEVLRESNRPAEAEPLYHRALRTFEESLGPDHPDTGGILNNLAFTLWKNGKPAEAEPLIRRAITIAEASGGLNNCDVGLSCSVLTRVLRATNCHEEAATHITRAMKIFALHRQRTGHEHLHLKTVQQNFRETLRELNIPDGEIARRLQEILESPDLASESI